MRTSRSGESALLLLDVVDVLAREQVDYAVIGAMAASVHGVLRASMDADAVLSITTQQLGQLHERFRSAGFATELRRGDMEDPIGAVLALSDEFSNRVDLLVGLRGLEKEAFERAIDVTFQGGTLRVVCVEDFIAMKVFAGGPQDLADARYALAAAKQTVDKELLFRLTARYGREAMGAGALRNLPAPRSVLSAYHDKHSADEGRDLPSLRSAGRGRDRRGAQA